MSPYFRPEDVPEFSNAELRQFSFLQAIRGGDVESMKRLLSDDIDLDVECSEYRKGNTLVLAAEEGSADAVAFLLSVGVRKDSGAISAAAVRGYVAILEILLAAGVAPDSDSVIAVEDPIIVRRLIEAGAPINDTASYGLWYALHNAVVEGNSEVVEVLLSAGANPDVLSEDGSTPLMMAVRGGDARIVALLIKAGANVFLKNEDDETAVDMARQAGFDAAVKLIEQTMNFGI